MHSQSGRNPYFLRKNRRHTSAPRFPFGLKRQKVPNVGALANTWGCLFPSYGDCLWFDVLLWECCGTHVSTSWGSMFQHKILVVSNLRVHTNGCTFKYIYIVMKLLLYIHETAMKLLLRFTLTHWRSMPEISEVNVHWSMFIMATPPGGKTTTKIGDGSFRMETGRFKKWRRTFPEW